MDGQDILWHFSDMARLSPARDGIPVWNLYGESGAFPDVLHIERITDRAAGLDWVIAPHRHPHLHQVFLIRAGRAEVTADGARMAPRPPFLLSVPAGVIHGFRFAAGTDGDVLTVPVQTLPDLLAPAAPSAAALGRTAVILADADVMALCARLRAEHAAAYPGRAAMLVALATEVICTVLRALPPGDAGGPAADPRFVRFTALVQAHLRDGWGVAAFARAVGLSERQLGRLCRAATGRPAAALVEAAVMREACRLLCYTRNPVAAVGYALGFADPSYFSRAFRRVMGVAPGTYRAGFDRGRAVPLATGGGN